MNFTKFLNYHAEVRIWKDQSPMIPSYLNGNVILDKDRSETVDGISSSIWIIEYFRPLGAKYLYGLLGAKVHRENENILSLNYANFYERQSVFTSSLNKLGDIRLGLPTEYMKVVKDRTENLIGNGDVSLVGEIDFCYAAYDDIGSNSKVFDALAHSLLKTLETKEVNLEALDKL